MAHFVVEIQFKAALSDSVKTEQMAFLEGITNSGVLIMAGVFPDAPGQGMSVIRADSLEAAANLYSQAPVVQANVIDWKVRPFNLTFGTALETAG